MPFSFIHRGFTLLEALIAIALGSLIIYAAVAGFRVSAQSITTANRLSLENSMLRAGFLAALHEVDTWTAYDDPESTTGSDRALRRPQLPFSPMPPLARAPSSSASSGSAMGQYMYPSPEGDSGWDPTYFWPPNDPRTWWRANAAEWNMTAGRSGNYAQFANTIGAPHSWLFNQMNMLQSNLSWYGYCDYLPPSMLYSFIRGGDLDPTFTSGSSFRNHDGGTWFPQGRYRCTKDTSYTVVPLKPKGGTGSIAASNYRRYWNTGVGADENSVKDFMNKALSTRPLLSSQPAHWPVMKIEVARFLSHNRFVNLNTVQWTNTLTGEPISLSFTAIGTTLRGARQMRKPGPPDTASPPGWARWYAPGSSLNDPTIDGPSP
jgi:prepilin-type N-terminal cleavage/methylation domain-containing protein